MMPPKSVSYLNRMLLMVPYIIERDGAGIDELCDRFDVDREMLLDDLALLWLCGLPDYTPGNLIDCTIDENDVVKVTMADFFNRPLRLTRDEALTVVVACEAIIGSGLIDDTGVIQGAKDRIVHLLDHEDREILEGISARIQVQINPVTGRWAELVTEGLERGCRIRIDYYSYSRGTASERTVDPLSLVHSRGRWYLFAWCNAAEETRLFLLDRIRNAQLTDENAVYSSSDFEVPSRVGEWDAGRESRMVRLVFPAQSGKVVAERLPIRCMKVAEDGRVELLIRTGHLGWLSDYLLAYTPDVQIESPAELKTMVMEKAARLLEQYER